VDYDKTFASIWHAFEQKGIPPMLIAMIKAQYHGFQCRVLHSGNLSEPFNTASGLRQGSIFSSILFLIVIDDILNRAVEG
jgi:hypothetical protein